MTDGNRSTCRETRHVFGRWLVAGMALLSAAAAAAQSGPDWSAIRQRAVALAQEVDAAERRLNGALTADAMTALLQSERFTIEQLALGAEAARKDPAVLGAIVSHLFARTEGFVVVEGAGESRYHRIITFDPRTGDVQYRSGNTAPAVGRIDGITVSLPSFRSSLYGICKVALQFTPALTAAGSADCGVPVPVTMSFGEDRR
jgi:hypothetical protein